MSRHIDADEIQYTILNKTGIEKQGVWEDVLNKMSTTDVVEVVRCKDCLHGSYCEDVLWCNITDEPMKENDFCSKGDRI